MSIDYTHMHAKHDGKILECHIHVFQLASAVTPVDIVSTVKPYAASCPVSFREGTRSW